MPVFFLALFLILFQGVIGLMGILDQATPGYVTFLSLEAQREGSFMGKLFLARFSSLLKTDMTELFPLFCLCVLTYEDVMPGVAAALLWPRGVVMG